MISRLGFIPTKKQTLVSSYLQATKEITIVIPVKDNQAGIKKEIQAALNNPSFSPYLLASETVDKGHGRIDIRRIVVLPGNPTARNLPGAEQIFKIERQRTDLNGKLLSEETVCGVTSLKPNGGGTPERLLQYSRGHWHVENKLHYVRDVSFRADNACIRHDNGAHVMACLRNFAINVFRRANIPVAKALQRSAWDRSYLLNLFSKKKPGTAQ